MSKDLQRHSLPYPTEVGAPKFEPVPVREKRDVMINQARAHAKQEHDRIMDIADVLKSQLDAVYRRLEVMEKVANAHCGFVPVPGHVYWLIYNHDKNRHEISMMGPEQWSCGAPDHLEYLEKVHHRPDQTWDTL